MLGLTYTLHEIAQVASARDLFQGVLQKLPLRYVSFDTRTISHGEQTVFVALKTANRDGHDFIPDAIEKGVRNFIVDRRLPYQDINYILSDDTLESLQMWALNHRQRFSYPVIGITGSNGKTTVKEWLATLLEQDYQLVKSPMSHNSQLGVALSLLQLRPSAGLALIEAGISRPGEMERLEEMIRPTLGILTHMGSAHADGFRSDAEKLTEKCLLFSRVEKVFAGAEQHTVLSYLQERGLPVECIGKTSPIPTEYFLSVVQAEPVASGWALSLREGQEQLSLSLPVSGEAAKENALLALLVARRLGMSWDAIKERLPLLYPVEMRTELITDNPEVTLINDSYNSDIDSIRNAFQVLKGTEAQPRRTVILSDVPHLGKDQELLQQEILAEAETYFGADNIWTVGPVFSRLRKNQSYASTDALLHHFRYEDFRHSSLLLKGARLFELERIIPLINRRLNATYLKVNLNQLVSNLRYLKGRIHEHVKVLAMVKASSYGSGTWEVARVLEQEGIAYLGVAYASEGIELRQKGLELPIMVVNPDPASLQALPQFDLEPQIIDFGMLEAYVRAARLAGLSEYRLHLKFDTGMGRLGFQEAELDALIHALAQYPDIHVISVASHLAAADDPSQDDFTRQQIARFQGIATRLTQELGITPFRHILNTAGALRFPEYAMEMVRLGIGLYGLNPTAGASGEGLHEITSLHSPISQVHEYPKGTSIGYGRSDFTGRPSRIATVPIGYADGIFRSLSNGKAHFLVHGQRVPTIGRVCMDMLMLDVTAVPGVQAGDEVVLFGQQEESFLSVAEVAEWAGTIPYEILTRISPRVRRVYVRE